jgi:hypothetical protein
MKINKTISIDIGLIDSLDKLKLNVSEYCNQKLWDYVTAVENASKPITANVKDIDKQIKELKNSKIELSKIKDFEAEMKKDGITTEKIKFLKSMSVSALAAKDMKMGWEMKFGEKLNWVDLKALKDKWQWA